MSAASGIWSFGFRTLRGLYTAALPAVPRTDQRPGGVGRIHSTKLPLNCRGGYHDMPGFSASTSHTESAGIFPWHGVAELPR
jgi:hypothetical protein